MKREFLLNIIFLLAVNLLIKPFYIFGIDREVQNLAGREAYGLYFAFFNFTLLFQIASDLGTQNFSNRFTSQNPLLAVKYFPTLLALRGVLGIAYVCIIAVVSAILYPPEHYELLGWIALNQLLTGFILFLRAHIAGLALYRTDSLISVVDKCLMILLCSILLWATPFREHFRIEWFIWCQTTTLSLTALVALLIVLRRTGRLRLHFHFARWKYFLRKSLPFALVILLMTLYSRIDAVMLERLIPDGPYQAGIYASAYRLLDASNMIGYLFATLLLPMFARLLRARERQGASLDLVHLSFKLLISMALTAAVAVICYRVEIMTLLYRGDPQAAGDVMGVLMASFVAMCTINIYGTLLTAHGDLKRMNQIFALSIVLNIGLNGFLIPRYQAFGAAWATCFTQFFVAIQQWWLAHRLLKLPIPYGNLFRLLVFSLALLLLAALIRHMDDLFWTIRFLFTIAAGAILSLLTGLWSWRGILSLAGIDNDKAEKNRL